MEQTTTCQAFRLARYIRESKGLSLPQVSQQLAEHGVSITFSHLSKFERGEEELSINKMQALAQFYGVSVDTLLYIMPDPCKGSRKSKLL